MKKLLRNKQAITPVLSNLLLTVIAVASMALITTATYVISTNLREAMSERVIIEDLLFTSPNILCAYTRNIGTVPIQVSAIYINGSSVSFITPLELDVDNHSWLNISFTWSSGDLYHVEFVTARGTHVGGYFKAP